MICGFSLGLHTYPDASFHGAFLRLITTATGLRRSRGEGVMSATEDKGSKAGLKPSPQRIS